MTVLLRSEFFATLSIEQPNEHNSTNVPIYSFQVYTVQSGNHQSLPNVHLRPSINAEANLMETKDCRSLFAAAHPLQYLPLMLE